MNQNSTSANATPAPRKLLTVQEVAELLSCTPRNIYRLSDSGKFPPPLKVGSLNRWAEEVIDAWIRNGCPRTRHTPAKPKKRGK